MGDGLCPGSTLPSGRGWRLPSRSCSASSAWASRKASPTTEGKGPRHLKEGRGYLQKDQTHIAPSGLGDGAAGVMCHQRVRVRGSLRGSVCPLVLPSPVSAQPHAWVSLTLPPSYPLGPLTLPRTLVLGTQSKMFLISESFLRIRVDLNSTSQHPRR